MIWQYYFLTLVSSGIFTSIAFKSNKKNGIMKSSGMESLLRKLAEAVKPVTSNPVANVIRNTYSFFYNFPKRNLLYETPPVLFKNTSYDYFAYYQYPHNLPPYKYYEIRGELPIDFFCFGLPGNTLPLGNWDPWFLSQVTREVVRKYRESELKHGRLAMLASTGYVFQENYHPVYPSIGGISATHMDQLSKLPYNEGIFPKLIGQSEINLLDQTVGLDYYLLILLLISIEIFAYRRNWTRWLRNEYDHQFNGNIGMGNLKQCYRNGDYGFDPFDFFPDDENDQKDLVERELNNGRLAMIGFMGMIIQEYVTGEPVMTSLAHLSNELDTSFLSDFEEPFYKISNFFIQQYDSTKIF